MSKDPYKYFRIEARELLDELGRGVLELERGLEADVIERLLRAAHTLKGAARVVGATSIGDLAHALEDDLSRLDPANGMTGAVDVLLARLDAASAELHRLTSDRRTSDQDAKSEDLPNRAGIRVDVDAVHAIARDLRELRALLAAEPDPDLVERRFRTLLERVESLRLVRVEDIGVELERATRDASAQLSKSTSFDLRGGHTRVDARVLDALRPALLHLVRNAVAHGIETPEVRRERGKPPTGSIRVRVRRRGSRVLFDVSDDGGGLDRDRLRESAEARGERLPSSDAELLQYLLRTNLTTSELTQISGRGVGLDVVREAIASVEGTVGMETSSSGTTFTLDAPVSLASLRALVVDSGDTRALIPLHSVRAVASTGSITDTHVEIDEEVLKHVPLGQLLGTGGTSRAGVVVESRGVRVIVGVEAVHGVRDHVTQPLPLGTRCSSVVTGACVDEGAVQLVLSPAILVQSDVVVQQPRPERGAVRILVVDDSVTTRMLEKSILESAGFEVETASSGEEGLDMVRGASFDALVVDVEMPGMSGFELVEKVRADPKLGATPIILVTSLAEREHVRRGESVGANGYLIKSEFNQDTLVQKLRFLTRGTGAVA